MKTYLPKEDLFPIYMNRVIDRFYPLVYGWKEIKETEDCISQVSPDGLKMSTIFQRKWTDEVNEHSPFPVCIAKRTKNSNDLLEVFYVLTGYPVNEYAYELYLSIYRFENQRFTEISQLIFKPNGDRMKGESTQYEFVEMEKWFRHVFSEDPKYRLWAITGNLFKEREN